MDVAMPGVDGIEAPAGLKPDCLTGSWDSKFNDP